MTLARDTRVAPKNHLRRVIIIASIACAATVQSFPAHALSVTFASYNPTTDIYVDWSIAGLYTETFTGATYAEGPWTVTLDSPVPAPLPGSADTWSIRVMLQRLGLSGGVTDYVGGTPAVSLDTFVSAGDITGDFSTYWAGKGLAADLTNSAVWFVDGSLRMKENTPPTVPTPSTWLLVGVGLAVLAASRGRRQ